MSSLASTFSSSIVAAAVAVATVACGPQPAPETTRGFLNAAIVCARDCPLYPALAPDSTAMVTRDEMAIVGPEFDCPPPVEWVVRTFDLGGGGPFLMEPELPLGEARPLEGYEALTCVDADAGQTFALQDGFELGARVVDHIWVVELRDADGQVLASQEWGDTGVAFCPSSVQRTVVVVFWQSIPGECAGAAPPTYGVVRY